MKKWRPDGVNDASARRAARQLRRSRQMPNCVCSPRSDALNNTVSSVAAKAVDETTNAVAEGQVVSARCVEKIPLLVGIPQLDGFGKNGFEFRHDVHVLSQQSALI